MYTTAHDESLRAAIRASKSPEDTCEVGSIADAITRCEDAVKQEKAATTTAIVPMTSDEEPKKDQSLLDAANLMIERVKTQSGQADLEDDAVERIKSKEIEVRRLFEANVALFAIPSSEKKVVELLESTAAGKMKGDPSKSFVGMFLDPALLGEPITAPHIRINPLNLAVTKA